MWGRSLCARKASRQNERDRSGLNLKKRVREIKKNKSLSSINMNEKFTDFVFVESRTTEPTVVQTNRRDRRSRRDGQGEREH